MTSGPTIRSALRDDSTRPIHNGGPEVIHDQSQGEAATIPLIEELFSPERTAAASASTQHGGVYPPVKRLLDIVLSIFALVVMSPVLLMCAVAIVLDDGFPIFFGHGRQTTGGAIFRCWKFRTMRKDAESRVAELRKQNLCDGPQVNIKEDPRITRVGKVLRKLQLDEFPQFFNVIRGDMSIVGPRPSPDNENQYCPAWREIRLSVRPGITGLWQVKRTREAVPSVRHIPCRSESTLENLYPLRACASPATAP